MSLRVWSVMYGVWCVKRSAVWREYIMQGAVRCCRRIAATQCCIVRYSAVQCSAVQCSAVQCSTAAGHSLNAAQTGFRKQGCVGILTKKIKINGLLFRVTYV